MKDTFGQSVSITLAGESHGAGIVAVLSGIAPGIPVDEDFIAEQLTKRRPAGAISTARQEADKFEILSGIFNGFTTGTPIAVLIRNENAESKAIRGFAYNSNQFLISTVIPFSSEI